MKDLKKWLLIVIVENIKFYLEASLVGLGKWLRFFGYQVKIAQGKIKLDDLIENQESLFLITSPETASLLEKFQLKYVLLPRESLRAQLFILKEKLNLKITLSLDRCTLCGEKLISVPKETFKERIPPKVWEKYNEFNYCKNCDKLYWEGDHIKGIKKKLKELLNFSL